VTPDFSASSVSELIALTPQAYADMWRFVFDIDLVDRVKAWNRPVDEPLLHLMAEPRQLRATIADAVWARLVDVDAALGARGYAADFAQRFPAGLDAGIAPVGCTLDNLAAYFDPRTAPEDYLDFISGWVGIQLEPSWLVRRRREVLLQAAVVAQLLVQSDSSDFFAILLAVLSMQAMQRWRPRQAGPEAAPRGEGGMGHSTRPRRRTAGPRPRAT